MKRSILVVILIVILSSFVGAQSLPDLIVHLQPIGGYPDRIYDVPAFKFDELNKPIIQLDYTLFDNVDYTSFNKETFDSFVDSLNSNGGIDIQILINGNAALYSNINIDKDGGSFIEGVNVNISGWQLKIDSLKLDLDYLLENKFVVAGLNSISLIVDPKNKIIESNKNNNRIDSKFYLDEEFIKKRINFPKCVSKSEGYIIFEDGTKGAQDDCEMDPKVDSPWATILLESFCENGITLRKRYDCGSEGKVCIDGRCSIPNYELIEFNNVGEIKKIYGKKIILNNLITEVIGESVMLGQITGYFPILSVDGVLSEPFGKKGEINEKLVNGLYIRFRSYEYTKGESNKFIFEVSKSPSKEKIVIKEEPGINLNENSENIKIIPYESIKIMQNQECGTCLMDNGVCVPFGTRVEGRYCDISKQFLNQKELEISCDNNYECLSNDCKDGKCVSTYSLLEKILNFLKNFFK